MKKILDSDWLRAVQFKCNTSVKSVTPVQLHIVILDNDWQKDNEKFCRPMISCKAVTKILYGNCEKSFLECEKMASRNIFRQFLCANFFMFVLLISNHTVFLVQFEINLHLWVFQKAQSSAFIKTHSCKLIPSWTRNRVITYTYLLVWSTFVFSVHTPCSFVPQTGDEKIKASYIINWLNIP